MSSPPPSTPTVAPAPYSGSEHPSSDSLSTASMLTKEFDQLTTAIHEVSEEIQACKQLGNARYEARLTHDAEDVRRGTSMRDQLAQMLAMTQESLRLQREDPVKIPGAETFTQDLQRAAFGTGGDAESASRSSMLELRETDTSTHTGTGT